MSATGKVKHNSTVQEIYDLVVVKGLTDEEVFNKVCKDDRNVRVEYIQWIREFYTGVSDIKGAKNGS